MRRPPFGSRLVVLLAGAFMTMGGARGMAQVLPCTPAPQGMVAWWPADGNANDITGPNDGTIVGGVTFAAGMVSQAFVMDGATGYVEVPDSPALDVTGQITIDAWINPVATGGRVVDKITAGGADGYLLDTYGGRVRMIVNGQSVSGASVIPTGAWSHVTGVYDGAQMRVYLNGVLDGSFNTAVAIPTNALTLRIGAASDGGSRFTGQIDEVELFNRALSEAEIQAVVAAGSAGKCKAPAQVPTTSAMGLVALAVMLVGSALFLLRSHSA